MSRVKNRSAITGEIVYETLMSRRTQLFRVPACIGIGFLAFMVTSVIGMIAVQNVLRESSTQDSLFLFGVLTFSVILGIVVAVWLLRATPHTLVLTTDGAYVRNGTPHFWLPWANVAEVENQQRGWWMLSTIFHLADGGEVQARISSAVFTSYRVDWWDGTAPTELEFIREHGMSRPTFMARRIFSEHADTSRDDERSA